MLKARGLNLRSAVFGPWSEDPPIGCPLPRSLAAKVENRWELEMKLYVLEGSGCVSHPKSLFFLHYLCNTYFFFLFPPGYLFRERVHFISSMEGLLIP